MKTQTETEERLERGRLSLEALLEILRPFLPRQDQQTPEPAQDWRVTSELHEDEGMRPTTTFVPPF